MNEVMQERIRKGVAWLDETVPGWKDRIDEETLDLANPCCCVLGQVFEDVARHATRETGRHFSGFFKGCQALGAVSSIGIINEAVATEYGFDTMRLYHGRSAYEDYDYGQLEAGWLAYLAGQWS